MGRVCLFDTITISLPPLASCGRFRNHIVNSCVFALDHLSAESKPRFWHKHFNINSCIFQLYRFDVFLLKPAPGGTKVDLEMELFGVVTPRRKQQRDVGELVLVPFCDFDFSHPQLEKYL